MSIFMLLNEIMDTDTDIRVDTKSHDITRMSFNVGDTEYTLTAHSVPEHEGEWFVEVAPQHNSNPDAKPRTTVDVFKIFAGVQRCMQLLLKNYPNIQSVVFGAKDTTLSNLINQTLHRKPLNGWKIADQKNGWFHLTRV